MAQELITYSGDRRLVLANGEAIRQPTFMVYDEITGSADSSTDLVTETAHGLIDGDKLLIRGATPPAGLTAGNYYFVRDATTNTFKLAATAGGAAIDLTTSGTAWTWVKQNWTRIRLGIRGRWEGMAASLASPQMAMGLVSGSSAGYGSATTPNMVGVDLGSFSATYTAGPPAFANFGGSYQGRPFKKVGAAYTQSANGLNPSTFNITNRMGWFIDITKANTNFVFDGGQTPSGTDLSDTQFSQIMELNSIGDIATAVASSDSVSGTVSFAANEVAGVLDHIFVFWRYSGVKLSFDIKARMFNS